MVLREFFATLGLDVDAQSFAKGELAAELVKASLEKLVDTAKEVVEKFIDVVKETAEAGEKIELLAQQTGLSTDELQNLSSAAEATGASIDTFTSAIGSLSRVMYAAKTGNEEAKKSFKSTGVAVRDSVTGQLRSAGDVLRDLADHFSAMPDGAQKTAQAMQLLGRSGKELIPLLNQGSEGIARLAAASPNLTEEQIAAGVELVKTQKQLAAVTKNLWVQAVAPLLPAVTALLKRYVEWRKANAGVMKERIQKYLQIAINLVHALGTGFAMLVRILGLLENVITGVASGFVLLFTNAWEMAGRLKPILLAVAGIFAFVAAPFLLIGGVIAGILLLLDDFRVYEKGGKSLFGLWKRSIDEWLKPKDTDFWFVRQIKNFIQLMKDAMEEWEELQDALDPTRAQKRKEQIDKMAAQAPKEVQRRADNTTIATARKRTEMGLPLSDDERRALQRQGLDENAFVQRHGSQSMSAPAVMSAVIPQAPIIGPASFGPPEAPSSPAGAGVTVHSKTEISVVQQPGEDGTALADRIMSKMDERDQSAWEDAAASLGNE